VLRWLKVRLAHSETRTANVVIHVMTGVRFIFVISFFCKFDRRLAEPVSFY
jgi:hypothetical protein